MFKYSGNEGEEGERRFAPTQNTHCYTQVFKYLILKLFVGWASVFLPTSTLYGGQEKDLAHPTF